jgi:glucose-6-phosphate dehydrogenase assembly protein OpcA
MANKRFGTQLKELLAGLDKNEKFTPSEFIERVKTVRTNGQGETDTVIAAALHLPRFTKKIVKAVRRSDSGRVVLYTRKGEPMVMTLERMESLKATVKKAQVGLAAYHKSRRAVA